MLNFSFEEFSKILINSGDLDPDYIFINNVCRYLKLGNEFKAKWILVKSVVYNSESELRFLFGYEKLSILDYGNERKKSKHSADIFYQAILSEIKSKDLTFYSFFQSLPKNAVESLKYLQTIKGIGKWASWKILDLASCCLDIDLDFTGVDFRVAYEFPLKGLLLLNGLNEKNTKLLENDILYKRILSNGINLLGASKNLNAPPYYNRKINIQEIETLFCKYHSYKHNKYKVYEDSIKLHKKIFNSRYKKISNLSFLTNVKLIKELS